MGIHKIGACFWVNPWVTFSSALLGRFCRSRNPRVEASIVVAGSRLVDGGRVDDTLIRHRVRLLRAVFKGG
jgi:hypothetical protein